MRDEDFEECQFIDGLYQQGNPECEACNSRIRSACRAFSIHNGLREPEYYLTENNKPTPTVLESKSISLAEKIKRVRKQW